MPASRRETLLPRAVRLPGTLRSLWSIFASETVTSRNSGSTAAHYDSFSGSLHQGHHIGCVTFSDDLNLREALCNILPVALGQLYQERAHVVLQITNPLCPRDGHNVLALREHPGECQLRRRSVFLAGQLLDRSSQLEVFFERLLSETG